MIPKGYCQCGCGQKTGIARQNCKKWGYIKGEPVRFVAGHQGNLNPYRNGKCIHQQGYIQTMMKGHPRADSRGYVFDHILIAEKAMGKHLPSKAEIHHVNENRSDNRNTNIVVCQDRAYHVLLHRRTKSLKESGHADWLKCSYCKKYDDPNNITKAKNGINKYPRLYHKECHNAYRRRHSQLGKEASR